MTREIALHCMKSYSELHSDICELCPIYGQTGSDHCFEDALQYVIGMLEQEPRWIPTSEGLPEKNVEVLAITDWGGIVISERFEQYYRIYDGMTNGVREDEIVAWMPLPQPYKAESEVEE